EPIFAHLQKNEKESCEIINNYYSTINNTDSSLYRYRQEYEESVLKINEVLSAFLEKEEETIQRSYPHYFEKYRTDGLEYNIYIGQSISPNNPFNVLYLKNIRLWQLTSMAEAARITHLLLPSLKVPLQTTQLILIHSQCISISFRKDERKFDVEGSYNIRYEVIKKRLDKVRIKGTEERLTQPGKIAIVYYNQKEVPEYLEYIEFLKNKNVLKPNVEFLELEELQGVTGMKALRVDINIV
ncbi:MAG TPA: GAF domain-containing protein, partial [Chitinophagaceae bacterium]|nr:GAF domain-containing protein [Chitinophagaceae bacterium]